MSRIPGQLRLREAEVDQEAVDRHLEPPLPVEEEEHADKTLTQIAESSVNTQAARS